MPSREDKARKESGIMDTAKVVLKIAILAVLGVGLGGALYFMLSSSVFELKEVVFSGNNYLTEKELKSLLGRERVTLFSSLKRIAWRLDASPWIKDVRLRKEYPRLLVHLAEAEPVSLLQGTTGVYLISDEGRMLQPVENAMPFLPVIIGEYAAGAEAFKEAVALARAVKETGLATEKNRVEIRGLEQGSENLSLSIDGLSVRVGKGQYEEKILRYAELSEDIARRNINVDYIDLRFSNRVVVKALPEVKPEPKAKTEPKATDKMQGKAVDKPTAKNSGAKNASKNEAVKKEVAKR